CAIFGPRVLEVSMKLRILIFLISAFFLVTGALFGQEYRGSVSGRVLDPSGAAVPNAHVTLTNTETKIHLTTDTNGEGNYTIPYLQPGIYNLRAERQGFKSFERAPIEVRINQLVQVDAQLELGSSTETINVQAETPLLDMGSASVGQTIDARRIQELPIQQGVPFHLIALSAGVVRTGTTMLDENRYDWSSIRTRWAAPVQMPTLSRSMALLREDFKAARLSRPSAHRRNR